MKKFKKNIQLQVPNLGDYDNIELLEWCKKEDENFEEGEEICSFTTDKASFFLEAPTNGILKKILVPAPAIVKVDEIIGEAVIS